MNEILFRIRKIFSESKKSQTEIGKMIGKTPQYVWRLLNVDNLSPSESVLRDICREFNINEQWLRTGEGDIQKALNIEFGEICAKIGVEDEKAKQLIIDYWHLSDEDKNLFWNFFEKFIK